MKHLKRFDEQISLILEERLIDTKILREKGDLDAILSYVEYYSDLLSFDKVFNEYLEKEYDKYPENDTISDILEKHPDPISIVEYAIERYKEIEEENKNDIEQLETIIEDIDDRSEYTRGFELKDYTNSAQLFFHIQIFLKKELIEQRYNNISHSFAYTFKLKEMKDLWNSLISATSRIENLGLEVNLDYRASKEVINFFVKRTN